MSSRIETIKRAIGLKPSFRRSGGMSSTIIVGAVMGILSGNYIFKQHLDEYFAEEHRRSNEDGGAGGGVSNDPSSSPPSS
mmetsp:Transcript_24382/g.35814  ORF Transcript_24382/g.35814 Transcript_24382/m.35814 type:complete len:80 (+) Transcript_24382:136-375(+)